MLLSAWPRCSAAVTFGGGMTIEYVARSSVDGLGVEHVGSRPGRLDGGFGVGGGVGLGQLGK